MWIDLIVILDKGIITYYVKSPIGKAIFGKISSLEPETRCPLPYYISISILPTAERTINEFYAYVMNHLTFFRKRSTVDTSAITGRLGQPTKIMQSFQFDSKSQVSFADEEHYSGKFHFDKCLYIYQTKSDEYIGNIAFLKWKDGGVVFYSGRLPPAVIFEPYYKKFSVKYKRIFPSGGNANDWCSLVLPIGIGDFEEIAYGELRMLLEKHNLYICDKCKIPGIPNQ